MADIGEEFRALHRKGAPFTLMNAWDMGSAKVLTALGAQAIGTTSSGHAFTLGRPDMGRVTRDEALAHAQDVVSATPLPVSGGFRERLWRCARGRGRDGASVGRDRSGGDFGGGYRDDGSRGL